MSKGLRKWLDERIGLDDLIKTQVKGYKLPEGINAFYTLGFVAMAAYMLQAFSGIFLMLYYVPHPDHAFKSVQDISNRVPFGWFFRQMHVAGSNLMVAVVFLHLFYMFFTGAYKKPREMTWIGGGLMLFIVLLFCLSGYLLPWSQQSFWATTIITSIPTAFPYFGDFITRMLRGGEYMSGITISRFFAIHVAFLPPLLLALAGVHLLVIRRTGISPPPSVISGEEGRGTGVPFFQFVMKGASMIMIYFSVMFFIIAFMPNIFMPEESNMPADLYKTPVHMRPAWYFLMPYQMLKLIPNKFLGISIELGLLAVFLLWPFFDTKEERNIVKRPMLLTVFIISLALWTLLTIWGSY